MRYAIFLFLLVLFLVAPAYTVVGDQDGDTDVDVDDINIILDGAGPTGSSPALPGDPRDLDGDGLITSTLDARIAASCCTRALCVPGNNAPWIDSASAADPLENQTAVIDVESTDPDGDDTEGAGLSYSLTGGMDQAHFSISSSTGLLTFAAAPDFENPLDADADNVYDVEVTVTDSGGLTDSQSLVVSVVDVNEAPGIDAIPDPASILEDVAQQTINLFGIVAGGPGETQTLSVTAASDNPTLIPDPAVAYTSPDPAGLLMFTPVADAAGTALITVTVMDDGGTANGGIDTVVETFTVSVTAVNDAPTIDAIPDPAPILEDAGQQVIGLSGIGAGGGKTQGLTVTASSDNTALIPDPVVTYSSPDAIGTLMFAPVANESGSAIITVTVTDDGGTAGGGIDTTVETFTVTVTPVNDAPTIGSITDPAPILEDAGSQIVSFGGVDAGGGESQTLSVTATSDNTAVIPDPVVSYSSPDASGSLMYTPVADGFGVVTITVTVMDDGGTTAGGVDTTVETFTVTVTPVNDVPTVDAIPDPATILEDAGTQTVILSGIGTGGGETQTLTVSASSNNTALIPDPTVIYTSANASGLLRYAPVANESGSAVITVTVMDDGGTANGGVNMIVEMFTINVTPVNDRPTLNSIADPAPVMFDAPQQTISLAGITAGGGESQTLAVIATSNNAGLIPDPTVTYTSANTTGSLMYTPVAGQFGIATITVTVIDNGGTANGGANARTRTFDVLVTESCCIASDPLARFDGTTCNDGRLTITVPAGCTLDIVRLWFDTGCMGSSTIPAPRVGPTVSTLGPNHSMRMTCTEP